MDRIKRRTDADYCPPRLAGCHFDKGGSAPAAPAAPDPQVQIQAEAKANRYGVISPFGTQTWKQGNGARTFDQAGYDAAMSQYEQARQSGGGRRYVSSGGDDGGEWVTDAAPTAPNASAYWRENGDPDQWTMTQTLDPSQQRQFDARNQIAETMLGRAQTQIGQLPSAPFEFKGNAPSGTDAQSQELVRRLKSMSEEGFNPSMDGSAVRDAVYKKAMLSLDPTYGRMDEQLDQKLSNMGLPIGSEAWGQARDSFGRERSNAYETAALDSVIQGANEEQAQFGRQLSTRQQNVSDVGNALSGSQSQFGADYAREYGANQDTMSRQLSQRQQQYNELAALLGGQQLNPVAGGGSSVDVGSAFANQQAGQNRQYQGQLAGYNSGVASNNATMGGLFALGAAAISDRRLKREIVPVGEFMPGVLIYNFKYLWDDEPQTGVMADEVLKVMPAAVVKRSDGYFMVDYGRLLAGRTVH